MPLLKHPRIFCAAMLAALLLQGQMAGAEDSRWGNLQYIGPDTISDIASTVVPSIVNITATTNATVDQKSRADSHSREDSKRLKRYFGVDTAPGDANDYMKVTGSGVIVRQDGYVMTSLHVVENALKVSVTLQDGRSFDAAVVARDRFSDLAMLKFDGHNLPVIKFGDANHLRLGDWVVAVGNQFGLGHTVTHGLVSGLGREAKGFEKSFGAKTGAVRFIQTDAPINPGSSGGPIINLRGEVVGINSFIRDDAQNIGFAIPSNIASEVSQKLLSAGSISHPYIGIVMRDPVQDPLKSVDSASTHQGVEVVEVKLRSPASSAGIVPGDVILAIDENPVKKSDDVSSAVGRRRVGDNLSLKINRLGTEKVLVVRVDQLPEETD